MRLTRRTCLTAAFILPLAAYASSAQPGFAYQQDRVGEALSPWSPGQMDIHILSTGRGDAALVVTPDGRSLMIDIGAASGHPDMMRQARLQGYGSPGEAVAAYVLRRFRDTGRDELDVLYLTHLHDDHVSGVEHFADIVPIRRLIDPDYPHYGYPPFEGAAAIGKYVDFVKSRVERGGYTDRLIAGTGDQFGLDPVQIRVLASRGKIWSGVGEGVTDQFPARGMLSANDYPNENAAGSAIRLQYGKFSAFFGGDLTCWADAGARPWLDTLTPAAEVCGPVTLALAPHHGLYTGSGADMVKALSPEIWVASTWHQTHPSPDTLARLLERRLNPNLRGVYLTGISPVAAAMSARLLPQLASLSGHVVVRVSAGGERYQVVVTDDASAEDIVTRVIPCSAAFERE